MTIKVMTHKVLSTHRRFLSILTIIITLHTLLNSQLYEALYFVVS